MMNRAEGRRITRTTGLGRRHLLFFNCLNIIEL